MRINDWKSYFTLNGRSVNIFFHLAHTVIDQTTKVVMGAYCIFWNVNRMLLLPWALDSGDSNDIFSHKTIWRVLASGLYSNLAGDKLDGGHTKPSRKLAMGRLNVLW